MQDTVSPLELQETVAPGTSGPLELQDIPDDVLSHVFSFLSLRELLLTERVSSQFVASARRPTSCHSFDFFTRPFRLCTLPRSLPRFRKCRVLSVESEEVPPDGDPAADRLLPAFERFDNVRTLDLRYHLDASLAGLQSLLRSAPKAGPPATRAPTTARAGTSFGTPARWNSCASGGPG